ncbi:MAG: biotin/lipoyl-binding protein [Burkholderiaceae bacterium]
MVTKAQAHPDLLSMQWYRVATLQPRLAPGVSVQRQQVRGCHWIVLSREDHTGQIRLNEAAWSLIGRCNGDFTLTAIWQWLAQNKPDQTPPQPDLLPILANLIKHRLLICDDWPDLDQRDQDDRDAERQQTWQRLNPLAPRLPLGDPSRIITLLAPIGRAALSPVGGLAVMMLLALALMTVWQHWTTLASDVGSAVLSAQFWMITWCVYPLIKAVHELAHGVVLHHYGGKTNVFGLSLLMFIPAPYVDASEADELSSGRERALVSMAGIVSEVILAAGAIMIWAWLSPGLMKDVLLAVALIGSVSTIMFNANPLIRFDGYYALTDLFGLTNLAERSKLFWRAALQRSVLGMPSREIVAAHGERPWLAVYAPASWMYRLLIMLWLASWLGHYSRVAGLSIIMLALIALIVIPLVRLTLAPVRAGLPLTRIGIAHTRLALALAGLLVAGLTPLPDRTLVQAVAWAPEGTRIRVNQPGVIESVRARDGELVSSGQTLLQLQDPQLEAQIRAQVAHIAGLENEWHDELSQATAQMTGRRELLTQAHRRLIHLQQNQARLAVNTEQAGRIRLARPAEDLPGRFVTKGELLAYVQTNQPLELRAVLTENQANQLRRHETKHLVARARSANGAGPSFRATVLSLSPDAIDTLPSDALAADANGQILTKMTAADANEPRVGKVPLRPTYQLDLELDKHALDSTTLVPGQRVWVRLDLGWRPLLGQLLEATGQAFSARMAPGWS